MMDHRHAHKCTFKHAATLANGSQEDDTAGLGCGGGGWHLLVLQWRTDADAVTMVLLERCHLNEWG